MRNTFLARLRRRLRQRFRVRLSSRITHGVDLASEEGADGPLGFLYAFPIWFALLGLILVLGYWYWAMALNAVGVATGARLAGLGGDGAARHAQIVRAGLGGYARDYVDHATFGAPSGATSRAVVGTLDRTVRIAPFPAPRQVTVRVGSVARIEAFYARPPEANAWE